MKKAALSKLLAGLAELLRQLAEDETPKPKPIPKVSPPPATGHQAYIRTDYSMCCAAHDEAFELSCRQLEHTVRFIRWR